MRLSDVVAHSGLAGYAEVALVLFFLAFVLVGARQLFRRDRQELEHMRRLPLGGDAPPHHDPGATP